jgi:hypothetical protein
LEEWRNFEGGAQRVRDCKYAHRTESGKPECKDSSMVLYVGLYCDPAKCEQVRKGEVKAI